MAPEFCKRKYSLGDVGASLRARGKLQPRSVVLRPKAPAAPPEVG